MAKTIALFNHKGGVSKTTTTFNLGWMLAKHGKKVIIVDTDTQCNLTGMVLGYKGGEEESKKFYEENTKENIWSALSPAFESKPEIIKYVNCIPVKNIEGLFLLPGNIRFAEYEVTLGIAHQLNETIQTLRNLPGAIVYLLEETAKHHEADIILIDMNPSVSSINQNILMTSDFFIIPASPDYFSVMAVNSLINILPKWKKWAEAAAENPILKEAEYPFPKPKTVFIGTILQNYRKHRDLPSKAFQLWINEFNSLVTSNLVPKLKELNMFSSLTRENGCLAEIPNFNSLIARSQDTQTPVFALTDEQLKQQGVVLDNMKSSRDLFLKIFSKLAEDILRLIDL